MKKAFDQTVRDLKRGVNKKVLKVPSIEQKVLDATSNEPWGPHGSLLADIAEATRNYHEYQMIMSVLWKRINDTGKNWRHVYKALTVLEYLVAHGSERVIDDIREHAYQISTLSDFQYIDSSGKDQGNNVRKKSQSIVVLVNDKERIQEARQKAAANREKYRNTPAGGMYRPGSGGYGDRYDDDRSGYGNRDDDRDGYGREREWASKDDDRYGRYGESYGREGDRYGRDNEERYGRDRYRDDDYNYSSRSRSADRERNPANGDDGQYSSRGSGAKADDQYQDGSSAGKGLDRKNSGQNFGAPPSYEDAVGTTRSPSYGERDVESSAAYAPKASSPTGASPSHVATTAASPPAPSPAAASTPASASPPASTQSIAPQSNNVVDGFDEFDPRGSFSAAPSASNGTAPVPAPSVEMDLLGSLSESFSSNSLALVPTGQHDTETEENTSASFNSGPNASQALSNNDQPFGDPFGDGPFRAIPSSDSVPVEQANSFTTNSSQTYGVPQQVPQEAPTSGPFGDVTYTPSGPGGQPPTSTQFPQQELSTPNQDIDILADILPPSAPSSFPSTQGGYPVAPNPPVSHGGFPPQTNQHELQSGLSSLSVQNAPVNSFQPPTFPTQPPVQASYPLQSTGSVSQTGYPSQTMALTYPVQTGQPPQMGFHPQTGSAQPNALHPNYYGAYQPQQTSVGASGPYMGPPSSAGPTVQHSFLSNSGPAGPVASHMAHQAPQVPVPSTQASPASSAIVPVSSSDKFETKSTVWADTLSRGLVNLNISGSKTNPLANIGVDFDAINRREKRMEKPTTTAVTSTVTMGKAMGSGSGLGRAGATGLRPAQNPVMNSNVNFGMAGGQPGGRGMGIGGYGGNQPTGRGMGMGMGMGMNMPGNMGMGANMPGNMGMGANMPGNMGMGTNMPGNMGMGMNVPGNMGMGMGMGMGMNMGMGQGTNMQQPMGPPGSMPQGYNPMMGSGNYGQQPYGGGYR